MLLHAVLFQFKWNADSISGRLFVVRRRVGDPNVRPPIWKRIPNVVSVTYSCVSVVQRYLVQVHQW